MGYIDFHCHSNGISENEIKVVSFNVTDSINVDTSQYATVGIHPWSTVESDVFNFIPRIKDLCSKSSVVGIGEIGLDRLNGAPLQVQEVIFQNQLEIALECNKPVVIHCVRAWSEMFKLLAKNEYSSLKRAVHGFRRQPEIAQQLVNQGFYISFGALLVDPTPELSESLTSIPISRLFFETDNSAMPIKEIYSAASDILNIPLEQLVNQVENNFSEFYSMSRD